MNILALAVALVPLLPAAASVQAETVPSGGVTIEAVTANGSTCRPGTVTVAITPDRQAFTVIFSEYLAQVGVGAKGGEASQKCKLNVTVNPPAGYTYAISDATYRGYATIAPGAKAVEQATYRFQGEPKSVGVPHTLTGPFENVWQHSDVADPATLVYSPCGKGRRLDIDTGLEVTAGTSDTSNTTSIIWMETADGSVVTTFRLAWKTCT